MTAKTKEAAPEKTKVHTQYKLGDGTRVPSVTTILGVLGKPALIHWAWQMGIDGKDYRSVRDEAADAGTLAHYLVLCHLKGTEPDVRAYSQENQLKATNSFNKFLRWEQDHKLEPIMLEEYMVSEEMKFGGTVDFYGKVNDAPILLDFKTSKAIYPDMFYQLAAYQHLLEQNGHKVEGCKILRIGRSEEEGFEERSMDDLTKQWEVFVSCLSIYELTKTIKKDFK